MTLSQQFPTIPESVDPEGWGKKECPYCGKSKDITMAMCSDCYEYFDNNKLKQPDGK